METSYITKVLFKSMVQKIFEELGSQSWPWNKEFLYIRFF